MQKTEPQSLNLSLLENFKVRFCSALLHGFLIFSLLFVQAVNLNHTHTGDLSNFIDCETCLKVGSNDDTLASTALFPVVASASTIGSFEPGLPLHSVAFRASIRAPPLA